MGKPKFPRRKYDVPLHPWKEARIKSERELIKKYGLKNHREVWKAKTLLRKYRRKARELLAKVGGGDPQINKESTQILYYLTRMSILPANCSLDDVLALDTETILSRRLQTLVYHRGFANTISHARQLVSHGHIAIGKRKITIPGYMVQTDEENNIGYVEKSPMNSLSHPARPKSEVTRPMPVMPPVPREIPKSEPAKKEPQPQPVTEPTEKPAPTEKKPEKPEEKPETVPASVLKETPVKKEEKPAEPKKEPEPVIPVEKPPKKKEPKKQHDSKKKEKKEEGTE